MKARAGAPVQATVKTAGTEGTSPQVYEFGGGAVRPCTVTNQHATEDLYVSWPNVEDASASNFMCVLVAGQSVDLSIGGIINVVTLSVWFGASGDYDDVDVRGWN